MTGNVEVSPQGEAGIRSAERSGKYLTFRLAHEEYGLQILKVQEIIGMMDVTRVPRMPEFMRGVINLRGKIIPVVDLRLKFGMEAKEVTDKTCIIVVQLAGATLEMTTGVLVDEVSEVMDIEAEQIEPPSTFGASVNTEFILGMGKVGKQVLMMLDIDRVLSTDDVAALEQAA